jgi:hypothetical protein
MSDQINTAPMTPAQVALAIAAEVHRQNALAGDESARAAYRTMTGEEPAERKPTPVSETSM